MKKILVMGVGNILLMDEGAGVYAVQKLQCEDWPENVEIVDGGTFTQDIFHILEGYDYLLVLDIVHAGGNPGDIYVFSEEDLVQNEDQRLSLHDVDLIDSLNMAEMVGSRPVMRVVGIEPKKYTDWGMELTPEVQSRFDLFLETARNEIKKYLDQC
jgi:hydrogenase maturation protease